MNCIVHGVTEGWTQLSDFHFSSEQPSDVPECGERGKKNKTLYSMLQLISVFLKEKETSQNS